MLSNHSTEYILRWKKNLINGDFRNYMKAHHQIEYKARILDCHYLEDIFYHNELQEINWKQTFDFTSKGSSKGRFFTNIEDNALRSYKIKNLLKILPTYSLLFDRECEHVIVDECPRCGKESETWEHVWICEDNDVSEYDVLIRMLIDMEEYYKTSNENKYRAIRILVKEIVNFD